MLITNPKVLCGISLPDEVIDRHKFTMEHLSEFDIYGQRLMNKNQNHIAIEEKR